MTLYTDAEENYVIVCDNCNDDCTFADSCATFDDVVLAIKRSANWRMACFRDEWLHFCSKDCWLDWCQDQHYPLNNPPMLMDDEIPVGEYPL